MITPEVIEQHHLTPEEYQNVLKILGREPTLEELGVFSVMWSEHCSYKSSRKFLKGFPTTGPQVIQGPGENAGVIDIGDGWAAAFKMESHNHPSFIEPYQGAATGVGGILRDVFTMGARPVALLNSLRFGEVDHPKTPFLVSGVVSGIAGYGNCMGIPTVGGDTVFQSSYNGNILVNAMTVGLVKADQIFKGTAAGPGNPLLYVGAKTGRDGIHGATMASDSFDEGSESKRPTVQVGDPFTEKRLLEACLELMARDVIVGIQDMGAAGLTSSSFEMASRAGTGLVLRLDQVPQREEGMTPYEILLSESQERMLLVAKKGREHEVSEIFEKWDLDASVIGEVTDTGFYVATFNGKECIRVPVAPLADGAPIYDRPRKEPAYLKETQKFNVSSLPEPKNYQETFLKILSHPNSASKRWVYRQYDHQVMTNTVVKPGSDAAVLRIRENGKSLAVTSNCNSVYCYLNPKVGSQIAVAEGGRNLVCSGAIPQALTDCLNFGNPENPEIMWQFEQAVLGISEACRQFEIPVVSGNVSLYNETQGVSIYPTPMIGVVGLIDKGQEPTSSFFQAAGDVIILLGETQAELGGSEYQQRIFGKVEGDCPVLDFQKEKALWKLMRELQKAGHVKSAHDLSEGGLAIALAESCFENRLGIQVLLPKTDLRPDFALFSESQSRILISISSQFEKQVLTLAKANGVAAAVLGVVGGTQFEIKDVLSCSLDSVFQMWDAGFSKQIFNR